MDTSTLKQAEIFAFLAALFLIAIMFSDSAKVETDSKLKAALEKQKKMRERLERLAAYQQAQIKKQKEMDSKKDEYIRKINEVKKKNPPIINLSENQPEYQFKSGSAVVPVAYQKNLLAKIIPKLRDMAKEYNCDTIEIIGHTDSQPLKVSRSTMDATLKTSKVQVPGSNLDLGMMRAINVMKIIEKSRVSMKLKQIVHVLPYSAGQFIKLDSTIAWGISNTGDSGRRRIEIRLRRSKALQDKLEQELLKERQKLAKPGSKPSVKPNSKKNAIAVTQKN